jgi:hypothetical protein
VDTALFGFNTGTMTHGYSGTTLIKKLGIKPSTRLMVVNPPADYRSMVGIDVLNQLAEFRNAPSMIHLFAKDFSSFETEMAKLKPLIAKDPTVAIWVSWYKKAAGIPTDLTEDSIRKYALQHKLVDVKVCAVNEMWSGLKLVVPLKYR